jgi:hypothetical protein
MGEREAREAFAEALGGAQAAEDDHDLALALGELSPAVSDPAR